jgi:DNA polymerase III subunit beta
MKFEVERDRLADAVMWAARALPARPVVPVLAGMRLHVAHSVGISISTFDYEVSAQSAVPGITEETGTVLVPGRLLAEICKALPPRPVEVATEGARVTVKCGSSVFTLQTIPADEYPTLPHMPPAAGKVGADLLASAISQVAVAAGRDDTLPALTGMLIEFAGPSVTLVATDRYRLAIRVLDRWEPARPDLDATVLVPARSLTEAARSFTTAAEVAIGLTAAGEQGATGIIGFEAGGRQTTTRLLGGEYPKYQSLLPTDFSAVAYLPVVPFADAVKRVALVAERNTPIRLLFTAGGLLLEAGAGDEATALETIDTSFDGGEDMRVAFNAQYLLEGLAAIDSDVARISFTTPTRPAVFTGKDESQDYRYVLMPVRSAG